MKHNDSVCKDNEESNCICLKHIYTIHQNCVNEKVFLPFLVKVTVRLEKKKKGIHPIFIISLATPMVRERMLASSSNGSILKLSFCSDLPDGEVSPHYHQRQGPWGTAEASPFNILSARLRLAVDFCRNNPNSKSNFLGEVCSAITLELTTS